MFAPSSPTPLFFKLGNRYHIRHQCNERSLVKLVLSRNCRGVDFTICPSAWARLSSVGKQLVGQGYVGKSLSRIALEWVQHMRGDGCSFREIQQRIYQLTYAKLRIKTLLRLYLQNKGSSWVEVGGWLIPPRPTEVRYSFWERIAEKRRAERARRWAVTQARRERLEREILATCKDESETVGSCLGCGNIQKLARNIKWRCFACRKESFVLRTL